MERFKMPKFINRKYKYIICPDIKCRGWFDDYLQCEVSEATIELSPEKGYKMCPHLDKAKKVVFCHFGHHIESKVNSSDWQRADCEDDGCYSMTFARMSNTTIRIPLEKYEKFLKLPVI